MADLSSGNIVQLTLLILIGFSIITWSIIIYKVWVLWRVNHSNHAYSTQFWACKEFQDAEHLDYEQSVLGRIANVGFKLLANVRENASTMLKQGNHIETIMDRSMRQQINKERKQLETGLALLASIGSTSPFVGLFGTVWGIMHALQSISHAKSASIDIVAAPIGEALIATAIGIAAAIPAVLAYNYFLRRIKLCLADFEYFVTDFLNLAIINLYKSNEEQ